MQLLEVLQRRCSPPSELSLRLEENRTKWRGQRVVDKPDTDTPTDERTDRPLIHRQTNRCTNRHTAMVESSRVKQRQVEPWQNVVESCRVRQTTDTQTDIQTDRQTTDIQAGKWKDHRHTDRQTDRQKTVYMYQLMATGQSPSIPSLRIFLGGDLSFPQVFSSSETCQECGD